MRACAPYFPAGLHGKALDGEAGFCHQAHVRRQPRDAALRSLRMQVRHERAGHALPAKAGTTKNWSM